MDGSVHGMHNIIYLYIYIYFMCEGGHARYIYIYVCPKHNNVPMICLCVAMFPSCLFPSCLFGGMPPFLRSRPCIKHSRAQPRHFKQPLTLRTFVIQVLRPAIHPFLYRLRGKYILCLSWKTSKQVRVLRNIIEYFTNTHGNRICSWHGEI